MSDEDDYSHLPVGSVVGGYEILSVLGSGGFGVTYLAIHQSLERKVALKECLPLEIAWRRSDSTVGPRGSGRVGDFAWAKERFIQEAKTLAQFSHESVVHVYDVFEANGTAYMPTGYVEGMDLEVWLLTLGRSPSEEELLPLIYPLLEGLELVHRGGVLHRDISPDNIFVTDSGRPVLLDFGSARQMAGKKTKTVVLKHGYAPFEQYQERGNQGPWTDVYAFCAVLHRCLTGSPPPTATDRVVRDPYEPLKARLKGKYSPELLRAIDSGLVVDEEKRPQSVDAFYTLLEAGGSGIQLELSPQSLSPEAEVAETVAETVAEDIGRPRAKGVRLLVAGLCALVVVVLGIVFFAPKDVGSISVRTDPSGATVEIAGLDSGSSPFLLDDVASGRYEAKLSKEGYLEKTITIDVERGGVAESGIVTLEPVSTTGSVRLESVPSGADVYLGGKVSFDIQHSPFGGQERKVPDKGMRGTKIGVTPLVVPDVKKGSAVYILSKEGYVDAWANGVVKAGEELRLSATLKKVPVEMTGTVRITSEPAGAVVLDDSSAGNRLGVTPLTLRDVALGNKSYTFRRDGYRDAEVKGSVQPGKELQLTATMEEVPKEAGSLSLESNPSGAEIFQGEKRLGVTPAAFTATAAGSYRFELAKDGYEKAVVDVEVTLGKEARKTVDLKLATAAAKPAIGSDWTVPDLGLDMKWIKPGSFQMGSPESEEGRDDDEVQHRVTLSKGFWLGAYEVNQGEWEALMGSNPSGFKGPRNPVENVSYDDALSFCAKLTDRERSAGRLPAGYAYSLPSEAQWEYACRAGTTGPYAGSSLDALGWYSSNSGSTTHAVGEKFPNAWGLYDMHGNVWEWCLDWYGDYPSGSVTDPSGATSGSLRVFRGGSWNRIARDCRSALRDYYRPGYRYKNLGLRLSLVPRP